VLRVGTGRAINAWIDPWVPRYPGFWPRSRDGVVEELLLVHDFILDEQRA